MDAAGEAPDPPHSAPPLHARILADVRSRILSGEWPPGHRIPFEHEFVESYNCSRMTVNKALSRLAAAGLIERRRKSGSFVARPHSESAVLQITDVPAEIEALGLKPSFAVIARAIRRTNGADRERLGPQAGARVLEIVCRHDAGPAPFCLEHRLINLESAPAAEQEPFDSQPPGSWLIARAPWTRAENRISAASASRETAAHLALEAGAACLVVTRRTWRDETPVTWVRLVYSARHELVARFSPADVG
jgi:GntR family transcriptional regulator, histidine utilization repressor